MEDTVMELRSSTSLVVVKEDHQEKEQQVGATDELAFSPSCTVEIDQKEEDRNIEIKDHQELESTKVEMSEVRKENERLKLVLARILEDYQSLQKHLVEVVQRGEQTQTNSGATLQTFPFRQTLPMIQAQEESELVSLSLGRTTSSSSDKFNYLSKFHKEETNEDKLSKEGNLSLGLDCKYEVISKPDSSNSTSVDPVMIYPSPENSFDNDEPKEDAGEKWQTTNNGPSNGKAVIRSRDDEVSQQQQQNPVKKPRVSVRTRCETPTMNDGCQWRKYGQKISKGNPCPRAYYRCTVAAGCPVRKQVQRCAEDQSILITTYEGNHSHPLSVSASAMASTTSAAASMLMSGSSNSRLALASGSSGYRTTSANLHGLNFSNLSSSSATGSKQIFYIPNSSVSSASSSNPTITLDLTTPSSSSLSSLSHLNRPSSNNIYPTATHKYSSTSFNFSSSSFDQSKSFTTLPTSWSNGYLSYGSNHQPYKLQNQTGSLNFSSSRHTQDHQFYQQYPSLNKNNISTNPSVAQQSLTADTIAAATKALTSDPVFQSALASAITSIVGAGGSGKWPSTDHQFPIISTRPTMLNGNGHGSSYMNVSSVSALASASSSSSQQGMSMFLQSSAALPFSSGTKSTTSGSHSNSMDDSIRDHS
ncbi:hypothetical protein MKW98_022880 [Papaver atlanticum]|uniref:WRKY domain-containing protein n=1 Tax=Papaver atlanticum TaxID=357466 RepID=A0AAD4TJB3_9MAGN|nr:hypothetical protein MKW98_022880 [Papaver atlanticum]